RTDPVPDANAANARWKTNRRDYYYDLARSETDRLETPFVPPLPGMTVEEGFRELARRAPRIFAGEPVTRPVDAPTGDIVDNARPSRLRGGNTLVFRTDLLHEVPNLSPRWNGKHVRRSDMIWATEATFRRSAKVLGVPFALEQDRSADVPTNNPVQSLLEDIFGYAFFRAYEKTFEERETPATEPITEQERATIQRRFHKFATERFMAFRLAFHRARGLAMVLRRCVYGDAAFRPWWLEDPRLSPSVESWRTFVHALEDRLTLEHLHAFESAFVNGLQNVEVDAFVQEQNTWFAKNSRLAPAKPLASWHDENRIRHARALVGKYLHREVEEVLGLGAEGVVLRAGDSIWKIFDGWTNDERTESRQLLQTLAARPRIPALPHIVKVYDWPEGVVLETRFEPSSAYAGGHGPALFATLKSLVEAGFVHTNVQPDNLRVTANGLQIVDVGRSLQTHSEPLEEAMIRRAFLSWRFAFRDDLKTLLRRSNKETDFAELVGWRGLLRALRDEHPKQRLDKRIEDCLRRHEVTRLLDYGCGKPRTLHQGAATNVHVVAFDPLEELRERWERVLPRAAFLSDTESLDAQRHSFDAVICALVLCMVEDDEAGRIVTNLRNLVAENGRVFVAVCDPTSVHVQWTTQQRRCNTTNLRYASTATYDKNVGTSVRREVHRSLAAYRRLFARGHLRIEREEVISGVDVARFEDVGEFVLFELSPLERLPLRTSLVIKACAMEADTIGHQVRHLVKQLGTPRGFDEVVVVEDPFAGPFPRQYQVGDRATLRRHLEDLLREKVIDRVVEGPADGDDSRAIAGRWFGVETARAHAKNGQATLALLRAFEECSGDIILHADADVLVGRPDRGFDHLKEAVCLFESIPTMVTLAPAVFGDENPAPRHGDARGPYRVETQIGWVHRERLKALRPLPNAVGDEKLEMPWHRAVDRLVQSGQTCSVRRGTAGLWYTSPDNSRKVDLDELFLLMDRVEAGMAPALQRGHATTRGSLSQWLEPKRGEDLVIVACGRNVGPGRAARFRDALLGQTHASWGAIVIDDGSDDGAEEYQPRIFGALGKRMTRLRRLRSVGALANLVLAVKHLVIRPDSVVVLVDLDDALGSPESLAEVALAHAQGADVTVGSMVRTDKHVEYPVEFDMPRKNRGGNVWQHLRTFRRALFDRIDPADLQIDGQWIGLASDWAFMLPIVEMARKPVWIRKPIYLHEPGDERSAGYRAERERVIATLMKRPAYTKKVAT
ncbi:MAG TPA: glycosyltransferase, partial [Polyangium sp.]|nr:glycosyltransferase [Polyangium sp.]